MAWEYCNLYWSPGSFVEVTPGDVVDPEWVKAAFPKSKAEYPKPKFPSESVTILKITNNRNADIEVAFAILRYLGSRGWEAFAYDDSGSTKMIWLKRPLVSAEEPSE